MTSDGELMAVIRGAFERHEAAVAASLAALLPAAAEAAKLIVAAAEQGGTLFTCGNGGSAADAQHFAGEFLCRYRGDRRPLPACALSTDTSALTAIGNDYSFDEVFSRQLAALGKPGDVLVAFTTSGRSPNDLRAIEAAKKKGMNVIAMTGAKGAALKDIADIAIVIPSEEVARIQEVHELLLHAWCEAVDVRLSES